MSMTERDFEIVEGWLREAMEYGEERHNEPYEKAIHALEEVQQYRAIGTVSEFAELKEKATAKKPIEIFEENIAGIGDEKIKFGGCPGCGMEVQDSMKYCMSCGTALDWSEGKE
jgi:hypothetical protein